MQARELSDLTAKGKELRVRIKELIEAVEKEQSATALATTELQVHPERSLPSAKITA